MSKFNYQKRTSSDWTVEGKSGGRWFPVWFEGREAREAGGPPWNLRWVRSKRRSAPRGTKGGEKRLVTPEEANTVSPHGIALSAERQLTIGGGNTKRAGKVSVSSSRVDEPECRKPD